MADVVEMLVEVLKNTIIPTLPEGYEQEQARAMVAVLRSIPVDHNAPVRLSQEKVDLIAAHLGSLSLNLSDAGLTPPRSSSGTKESSQEELEQWNTRLSTAIRESCGNSQRDDLRREIRHLLRLQIDWEMSHQGGQ